MLLALADGRAFTASELAKCARVAPSTASEHLGRLLDARLLAVVKQGRNHYYRLADPMVVDVLEDLARLAPPVTIRTLGESERANALRQARMCYQHLAGALGVRLTDALVERGLLQAGAESYRVTADGMAWLGAFGIAPTIASGAASIAPGPRKQSEQVFVPWHIDWSERKPHVAGAFGVALARRLFELRWLERQPTSRAVRVTALGTTALEQMFGLRM